MIAMQDTMIAPQAQESASWFDGSLSVLDDGLIVLSSHRQFAHSEEDYDGQYAHEEPDLRPGERFVEILSSLGMSPGGSCLELGAGTGQLSVGLKSSEFFSDLIVTDGSLSFLRIAKEKLAKVRGEETQFALLRGEDSDKLADSAFDVVVMRSVLHHILDFPSFCDLALQKVKVGGYFCVFEPRAESFFWMATVITLAEGLMKSTGVSLNQAETDNIDLFLRTMQFYLCRDMDKSDGEDKYAFWMTELMQIAHKNGAMLSYHSHDRLVEPFSVMFDYLFYCMGFDKTLVDKVRAALEPYRARMETCLGGIGSPDLSGWYVMQKFASTALTPVHV